MRNKPFYVLVLAAFVLTSRPSAANDEALTVQVPAATCLFIGSNIPSLGTDGSVCNQSTSAIMDLFCGLPVTSETQVNAGEGYRLRAQIDDHSSSAGVTMRACINGHDVGFTQWVGVCGATVTSQSAFVGWKLIQVDTPDLLFNIYDPAILADVTLHARTSGQLPGCVYDVELRD